jgi:hypothetical protein
VGLAGISTAAILLPLGLILPLIMGDVIIFSASRDILIKVNYFFLLIMSKLQYYTFYEDVS